MDQHLQVYYDSTCSTSSATQELIATVRNWPFSLSIEVVDLCCQEIKFPKAIIAVPAYRLNGEINFLGNPTPQDFINRLYAQ
jgi:hypothetical protein